MQVCAAVKRPPPRPVRGRLPHEARRGGLRSRAEVDKLRSMFEAGGATEFEVTDRGLCNNAYEIKGFADSHQYMLRAVPRGTVAGAGHPRAARHRRRGDHPPLHVLQGEVSPGRKRR